MKKIAVFTEGQTEQLLVEAIIMNIAEHKAMIIVKKDAKGGRKGTRNFEIIEVRGKDENANFYILLINCGTDKKVVSDILDNHQNLIDAGYQKILAIRDVYPDFSYEEVDKFRHSVDKIIKSRVNNHSLISFMLAVMEVEAWFLAEYTHFQKIHENLSLDRIKAEIGIDLQKDDLSKRERPAKDLSDIYWLESIEYDKGKKFIQNILNVIDKKHLSDGVKRRFPDLNNLYSELETFFE